MAAERNPPDTPSLLAHSMRKLTRAVVAHSAATLSVCFGLALVAVTIAATHLRFRGGDIGRNPEDANHQRWYAYVSEFGEADDAVILVEGEGRAALIPVLDDLAVELSRNDEVFEAVLNLAVELANQGREGKPVGATFVIGDYEKVMQFSRQTIFNPFRGYPEDERNILNPQLCETVKEFSVLDGAFVISEDGVVMCAGRHLSAALDSTVDLPRGLGSRHVAAAGITSVTEAVAIVISESTGDVRIFKDGAIFMEIEKPAR